MASNPVSSACYQGFLHEGQPRGEISKVKDFEVYTTKPTEGSYENGVLILTDIIGHGFNNFQLIGDQLADRGYFVMIPDLFDGDAIPLNRPEGFDQPKWRSGGYGANGTAHTPENIDPVIQSSIDEMRGKYGCKHVGAMGYCFGAKYVVRYLRKGKLDAGYLAHPSNVTEGELRKIQGPLTIAAAETDGQFPEEKRHESEKILKELGVPYQINLYGGVNHGYAVRGDISKKHVRYAKEAAFHQAVQWFGEHL